ncbi:cysteine hydrolase family protein [Penicillium verhagenii]|uniref:cysteine hydrolase family protein n=1 Tax=Penicillium verhagenii TaxID=1562060 RepID=UPI002544EDAA|nr:cysteine hydrolase family protein [Penicillium verhagenii]KAJ5924075.1 cysteine hydrolase family protein [Penicillium verhagenii]
MVSPNGKVDFGQNYAVLNLDWMPLLLNPIEESPEGQSLIANYSQWNNVVHKMSDRPLTIFTTLQFNRGQSDVKPNTPFSKLIEPFGTLETGSPGVGIDPRFTVDEEDVVLSKTRWSATTGNNLEQLLKAQDIDTVVISGLSLTGVVMSTIYRLFDLDYNIFVIADSVLELPPSQHNEISRVILGTLLPKMNIEVITLGQALQALLGTSLIN